MVNKKHIDQKLIASKQDYEMEYVCSVWYDAAGNHLSMKVLKEVVKKIGKSRKKVYVILKYLSYHYDPRKKKK